MDIANQHIDTLSDRHIALLKYLLDCINSGQIKESKQVIKKMMDSFPEKNQQNIDNHLVKLIAEGVNHDN